MAITIAYILHNVHACSGCFKLKDSEVVASTKAGLTFIAGPCKLYCIYIHVFLSINSLSTCKDFHTLKFKTCMTAFGLRHLFCIAHTLISIQSLLFMCLQCTVDMYISQLVTYIFLSRYGNNKVHLQAGLADPVKMARH